MINQKAMAKISATKIILCELLRLRFKRKSDNINHIRDGSF